jgi:hypothetical protein
MLRSLLRLVPDTGGTTVSGKDAYGIDLVNWGCQRNESRQLPGTAWTMIATVEAGKWAQHRPERVEVPAALVLHNGRWIAVRQGVQGLLVRDEAGTPTVYVLC